ncbi:hypothetical protein E2C01_090858 [Portunus trituberculatus]|uniref:Uncharacterized protein n=1 Tax=Portunus trituberculatus TaxID=210409 RepID=A0A5B7JLG7_PORTR|nr:hypothetical protein [Portunus trituberculatus]
MTRKIRPPMHCDMLYSQHYPLSSPKTLRSATSLPLHCTLDQAKPQPGEVTDPEIPCKRRTGGLLYQT